MKRKLVTTAQEILQILANRPDESFYVNELIRLTGRYPNSVVQALNRLLKDDEIIVENRGNRRYYQIKNSIGDMALFQRETFDWVKLLNRRCTYAFNIVVARANNLEVPKKYGYQFRTLWFNGLTDGLYYSQGELKQFAQVIVKKITQDLAFVQRDVELCREQCDQLVTFSKDISKLKLEEMSYEKLSSLIQSYLDLYQGMFPFIVVPHAVERYFEGRIRAEVKDSESLELLLSPVNLTDPERDGALKLVAHLKDKGEDEEYQRLLQAHTANYCWLPLWSLESKTLTAAYFNEEVKQLAARIGDPQAELQKFTEEEVTRKQRFEEVLASLESRELRDMVRMLQEYIYLRTYRKNAICQAHYYHLPLLHEAGRRLGISSLDVVYLDYPEIIGGLKGEIEEGFLIKKIQERRKGWAILMWEGKIQTITGIKNIVQTMEQYRIVQPQTPQTIVLQGRVASRGRALGKAKIVTNLEDLGKVRKGDVLVAKMTTPDYVVAMRRASAIVTDEGGATCHAAIVSRELGIPCVVATGRATQLLKDNDLVEVNATKGTVRVVGAGVTKWDGKIIRGKMVFPGQVRGSVRVVTDATEVSRVKPGDILVTSQVTPDFLSVLYRVDGLIIDEDSLTGHGVLYAKALNIPCIMGTQFAREVLVDGQQVTLNAASGVVKV